MLGVESMRKTLGVIMTIGLLLILVGTVAAQAPIVNIVVDFSEGLAGWRAFGSGTLMSP